jgi:N utilization substance protein B
LAVRSGSHLDRTRARAWVLQIHYRWESAGGDALLDEALRETVATRRIRPERLPYIRRLVNALDDHGHEVDRRLQAALDNWRLDRLSAIDRGILRLSAVELLYLDDIPPKVSIQEAIHLAERYGGPESSRFVNGVLDALYKSVREGG